MCTDSPQVSVIIPFFNGEMFIEPLIHSLLIQTFQDFEIIVVNDHSTSLSYLELRDKIDFDKRIRVVQNLKKGVSSARNYGAQISKGKFLRFIDADDIIDLNNLEKLQDYLYHSPYCDLVYTGYREINSDGKFIGSHSALCKIDVYNDLVRWNGNSITCPSGWLVKKNKFLEIGGFDERLSNNADFEFLFRFSTNNKIGIIPDVLWSYRKHSANMSSKISLFTSDTKLMIKILNEKNIYKTSSDYVFSFVNTYMTIALSNLECSNYLEATKCILLSVVKSPSCFVLVLYLRIKRRYFA
jgi:glycosyltransferase involved in cell wall biosynthesis